MKLIILSAMASFLLFGSFMKLTPDEFVVKPHVARYWKFQMQTQGRVVGAFRASGGAHNDIRVLITDADECENWINGNSANAYYDSGLKTVGKIEVNLNPANYCIIFDNRNSLVSAKEVATRIDASF